jgi:hypothetical protein
MPYARAVESMITGLIFEEFIHVIFVLYCGLVLFWREKWRGRLSETIKAHRMRERKEEGHYSGKRIKTRLRAFYSKAGTD